MGIILDEQHEFCLFGRIYSMGVAAFLFWNFEENAMEISVVNEDFNDKKY